MRTQRMGTFHPVAKEGRLPGGGILTGLWRIGILSFRERLQKLKVWAEVQLVRRLEGISHPWGLDLPEPLSKAGKKGSPRAQWDPAYMARVASEQVLPWASHVGLSFPICKMTRNPRAVAGPTFGLGSGLPRQEGATKARRPRTRAAARGDAHPHAAPVPRCRGSRVPRGRAEPGPGGGVAKATRRRCLGAARTALGGASRVGLGPRGAEGRAVVPAGSRARSGGRGPRPSTGRTPRTAGAGAGVPRPCRIFQYLSP